MRKMTMPCTAGGILNTYSDTNSVGDGCYANAKVLGELGESGEMRSGRVVCKPCGHGHGDQEHHLAPCWQVARVGWICQVLGLFACVCNGGRLCLFAVS